ncbi:MAG: hypothetical protein AVDCRST_MAG11-3825, partial [uncultured Gemmatimonadaceae bacterium]
APAPAVRPWRRPRARAPLHARASRRRAGGGRPGRQRALGPRRPPLRQRARRAAPGARHPRPGRDRGGGRRAPRGTGRRARGRPLPSHPTPGADRRPHAPAHGAPGCRGLGRDHRARAGAGGGGAARAPRRGPGAQLPGRRVHGRPRPRQLGPLRRRRPQARGRRGEPARTAALRRGARARARGGAGGRHRLPPPRPRRPGVPR